MPPAHYGFLASGVGGEETLRANRDEFGHYHLRPRRLVGVGGTDISVSLFGEEFASPVGIAPVGLQLVFNREAVAAVARAAQSGNHLQILSTQTNTPLDQVNAARGRPVWFQLCASDSAALAEQPIRAAEMPAARCWW
nr:alpha-hydroxy-acid oxidizing protein [Aliiruegeria haliotis]